MFTWAITSSVSFFHYCRAKKFRDRNKSLGYEKPKKKLTKSEEGEKRKYNREKKRESRRRLSELQKETIKQYDRARHTVPLANENEIKVIFLPSILKASQRVRKIFPKSPSKFVSVLKHVIKSTLKSPRKKRLFNAVQVQQSPVAPVEKKSGKLIITNLKSIKRKRQLARMETLKKLKSIKKNKNFQEHRRFVRELKAKYNSLRKASVLLGVRWNTLQRMCSFPLASKSDNESIKDFYINSEISITLPDKKSVGVHYLNRTLNAAYEEYLKTGKKVSFSTFYRLKPKRMKLQRQTPNRQCICEICANCNLALEALSKAGIKVCSTDLRKVTKRTVCSVPTMECIKRICERCGVQNVINDWVSKWDVGKKVSWKRWVFVTEKGSCNIKRKLVLSNISGDGEQLIEMITKDLGPLALHLFNADWHHKQFRTLIQDVPERTLVQVLDFAKNYLCTFQDEPQGCYWDHGQATIHPIVCYYKENSSVVTEELIFITDDLQHDSYAVKKFEEAVMLHFRRKGLSFDRIIQFCDQCPGQYKSHAPFEHLSLQENKQRLYFGSRHGKGPADGAIGRVKRAVSDAVRSRRAIVANSMDFFTFCSKNLETTESDKLHQMHFYYLEKGAIDRSQKSTGKTVPGTRLLHQVSTVEVGKIKVRNIGCTCRKCLGLSTEVSCPNADWIGPWKEVNLLGKHSGRGSTPKGARSKKVQKPTASLGSASKCTQKNELSERTPGPLSTAKTNTPARVTRSAKRIKGTTANNQANQSKQSSKQSSDRPQRVTRSVASKQLHSNTAVKEVKESKRTSAKKKTTLEISACRKPVATINKGTGSKKMLTWGKIQTRLSKCHSFQDMQNCVQQFRGPELCTDHLNMKGFANVDKNSIKHVPSNVTGLLPVTTLGDGNCFPRALSTLVYGNQFHFQEMRGRIVYEGVQNMNHYLRQNYLTHGANVSSYSRAKLSEIFTQYSEEYRPGTHISPQIVNQVYQDELLKVAKNSSYCGVWQIFMAANVLQQPVFSHYPDTLNANITNDLNRTMYPINPCIQKKPAVHILWTYMNRANGYPNHFVPLLPIEMCDTVTPEILQPHHPHEVEAADSHSVQDFVNR